ncbi:hypothetical protein [Nakamurella sp. GG22]
MTDTRLKESTRLLRRPARQRAVHTAAKDRPPPTGTSTRRPADGPAEPTAPPAERDNDEQRRGGWFDELVRVYGWAKMLGG